MRKLHLSIAFAIVLAIIIGIIMLFMPTVASAAGADDEVTIRVMDMHEKSTSAVMNRIQLPAAEGDKPGEQASERNRLNEHKADAQGTGQLDTEQQAYQDQVRELQQDREMDMIQDQIRDAEIIIDREQPIIDAPGAK